MTVSSYERTAQDLLALLPLLGRLVIAEVRREVGDDAASGAQLRMLQALREQPQTLSALARQQHVSPQALCDVAHALIERGWLVSVINPQDRRQHMLQLTDAGLLACEEGRARALQQLIALLGDLRAEELAAVQLALPALQRVLTHEPVEQPTG